ncbi:MAG TPA: hypothetical protein VFG10_08440 [Saprospiraceae bacterium]|nr:hypothetical protein [Saprospiraceae bacterium]
MPTFENRQIAIEKTLIIEDLTSKLIKHLVGLDLHGDTKALDNKSSSISLKSKIDLLSDCGMIDKVTYSNLQHVISIRNQFAHNFECNNFEDLPKFLNGIEKPLLKYCNEITDSAEEQLKTGFLNLATQAFKFLLNEFDGVTNEHGINLQKVKVRVTEIEENLLNQYKIVGARNRAIFLRKLREFNNEEGKEESKDLKIEKKISDFIKDNPDLKNPI